MREGNLAEPDLLVATRGARRPVALSVPPWQKKTGSLIRQEKPNKNKWLEGEARQICTREKRGPIF